ncbi:hypothetical protein BH10PSE11_BH10PSE11_06370 [soil metagenome]
MSRDSFNELATTVNIIERQITVLKHANLPLAVKLLEMTRLELLLNMNAISRSELESFCSHIRDAIDQEC